MILLALVAAWRSDALHAFGDANRVRALLDAYGPWAYAVFLATFAVLQPLGIPALLWILAAAILWPFPVAFALSLAGALLAASVGFVFARYLARDWVAARLPPRLRRFDERLVTHGLRAVILIRLVFLLSPPTHWLLGLSGVRYAAFALGTIVGSIPNIAIVTYFGEQALRWVEANAPAFWIGVAVVAVIGVLARRALPGRK